MPLRRRRSDRVRQRESASAKLSRLPVARKAQRVPDAGASAGTNYREESIVERA